MAVAEHDPATRIARAISWDGEDGSWADVLARSAAVPKRRRAPRFGRTTLVAAVLVLLGGSLALAVGNRVVHALTGTPAPPAIKKQLRSLPTAGPSDGAPPWIRKIAPGNVVASSARLLITLKTRRFGVVHLYAARTDRGGSCDLLTSGRTSRFTCNGRTTAQTPAVLSGLSGTRDTPGSNLVSGSVLPAQARSLRVRFRHGAARTVPLVAGHFLFELGPGHSRRSQDPPVAFDVLDASGNRIASQRDPVGVADPTRPARAKKPLAPTVHLLARQTLPNGGGTVSISRGRAATGIPCFLLARTGPQARRPQWQCEPDVGQVGHVVDNAKPAITHRVPVFWQLAVQNDWTRPTYGFAYAYGWVGPAIARLRLRFQDGESVELPLHDRYYLYVVPQAAWADGHRPSVLDGFGADGALAYHQFLYPREHCIYPGRDRLCAGHSTQTG